MKVHGNENIVRLSDSTSNPYPRWTNPYGPFAPPQAPAPNLAPCPGCGTCPVCGRRGIQTPAPYFGPVWIATNPTTIRWESPAGSTVC